LHYGSLAFTAFALLGGGARGGRSSLSFLCLLFCIFLFGLCTAMAAATFAGLLGGLLAALLVVVSDLGGGDVVRRKKICEGRVTAKVSVSDWLHGYYAVRESNSRSADRTPTTVSTS